MSASTRTVQQPLGLRQLGAVLVAVALALVLAAAVAIGQLATSKVQTAPAPGAAPVFIDHGSRAELDAAKAAPVFIDHGSRSEMGATSTATGSPGYMSAAAAAAANTAITSRDEMRTARDGSVTSSAGGPRLRPR